MVYSPSYAALPIFTKAGLSVSSDWEAPQSVIPSVRGIAEDLILTDGERGVWLRGGNFHVVCRRYGNYLAVRITESVTISVELGRRSCKRLTGAFSRTCSQRSSIQSEHMG